MTSKGPPGEEALKLEARRRIYDHIRANPGCYKRELQRALDLGAGNLDYHLDYLERKSLVSSQLQDNYKRYYAAATIPKEAKAHIALLRQQIPRRIVVWLLEHPGSIQKGIAQALGLPPSSLAFHLRKLLKAEIVSVERVGRESHFSLRDPEPIVSLLLTYRASLLDTMVDRFLDTFSQVQHIQAQESGSQTQESLTQSPAPVAPPEPGGRDEPPSP